MEPNEQTEPKKKKKVWLVILIILAALLLIGFFLLWWFKAWFFAPHLNTSSFDTEFLAQDPEDVTPPSEEQMARVAEYVDKILTQQERRLSFEDRAGAKKLRLIFDHLTQEDVDIERMFRDLGIPLESADKAASLTKENDAAAQYGSWIMAAYGAEATGESAPENQAPGDRDPDDPSAAEEDISLPQSYVHGSRLTLVSDKTKTVTCKACQKVNPAENQFCEKCGAELYPNPATTAVGDYEPSGAAGAGMTPEQQESLLISNVANTLLLANRTGLSYYMAALACAEDPYNVSAIVTLVTQLRMRKFLDEALAVCIHGLEIDPAREELYIHAGHICIEKDEPDRALAYFSREMEINGFSGPAYQGMMLAYLQKGDHKNAFRCMVEGAKDGYTSSIRIIYDLMKLRGDYYEIAGSYFATQSIRSMMDFTVNRSGFNPATELKGKVVDIGAAKVPARPADWIASAEAMIKQGQQYLGDLISFYSEDIKDIASAYEILLTADSLSDLANGFKAAFGNKFSKEKLTEAERVISYEQEVFWLDILDDYREWKVKAIRSEIDEALSGSDMEALMSTIQKYLDEAMSHLEELDRSVSMESLAYAMQFLMERVMGNHSIAFTSEQSEIIVSKIEQGLLHNANVRNKAYQEIAEMLGDYFMYSNALLGMVADKELYNEYRRKITLNVATDQGICVGENAMFAVFVPILAEPYLLIGSQTQDSVTGTGGQTGSSPKFPKFIVSSRPATPSADMYGDIMIPDISKVTLDVLGIGNVNEPADDGKEHYPAFRDVWEINWKENHPGEPIPAAPNFNDPFVRENFWNGLTPEQRVKYSAIMANPDVVNATFSLNPYCGRGQSVTSFQVENIGLGGNLSLTGSTHGVSAQIDADGTVTGEGNFGIGKVSIDSNKNMSITLKDKALGLSGGIKQTGRDLTTFMGISKDASLFGDDVPMSGIGVSAKAQIYSTYTLGPGQITSGGAKGGASAVMAGIIGIGYDTNVNVVQGQSTTNLYLIFAGKKITAHLKDDFNYEDNRTTKDIPGLQEFHK